MLMNEKQLMAAQVDVLVYGGTPAGVAAAAQAARMGRSVVLVEPGQHLGGMTSGGISTTEIGEGPMLEPGNEGDGDLRGLCPDGAVVNAG